MRALNARAASLNGKAARAWMLVGARFLPFADAASPELPLGRLLLCGVLGWLCTLVFAAFGLFMGYLLPSENVMQVLGPALALLSFAGGLFVPLDQMSDVFAMIATFTPAYGVGVLSRSPFGDDGSVLLALVNILVWASVFVGGAAWRMSRDTQRT